MLFKDTFIRGIRNGSIDRTIRRWRAPRVRRGGIYRLRPGLAVEVTGIAKATVQSISTEDVRRSGFDSRDALLAAVDGPGTLYRVDFVLTDAKPKLPPALDIAQLVDKLEAMDRRSKDGAWTTTVLALIDAHPECRAAELAPRAELPLATFKARTRRLKALGLTESCDTGYRLTARGAAVLESRSS